MTPICFATNNLHKLEEVRAMLGHDRVRSLADIGCHEELPEDHETLEENSMQKALHVAERYRIDCIADDSGLEVDALQGAPGVWSAMYAGPERDSEKNIDLLLHRMQGVTDRRARFRTVITLVRSGRPVVFTGEVSGVITDRRRGGRGFGYDPVFLPDGFDRTMAELSMEEKNRISHRAAAVRALVGHLSGG